MAGVVESAAVPLLCGAAALLRWYRLGEWPLRASEVDWLERVESGAPGLLAAAGRAFLEAGSSPGLALRLVPFLAGILSLPLLYGAARATAGRHAALALLVLLALSPYHLFLSTSAGTDVVFFAASTLGFLLLAGPTSAPRALARAVGVVLWGGSLAAEHLQESFLDASPIGGHDTVSEFFHDVALAVPLLAAAGLIQRLRPAPRAVLLVLGALVVSTASAALGRGAALDALVPGLYVVAGLAAGSLLEALSPRLLSQLALAALLVTPALPVTLSQLIDHGSHDVPAVAGAFRAEHRPREPVFALDAPLARLALGVPCRELPANAAALEQELPAEGRAFVVLLLERGRLVRDGDDAGLTHWIEQRMHLVARSAPRRLDRYRFEVRLYRWTGEE